MRKITKIVLVIFLGALLVLIRAFEDSIFYDPLIDFFKAQTDQGLPDFDSIKLMGGVTLRYLLNTVISLAVLWVIFQSREILKLSAILYGILFVILFTAFSFLIYSSEGGQHMALFYVRRFLIQPLFLMILIPAFYFQKNK